MVTIGEPINYQQMKPVISACALHGALGATCPLFMLQSDMTCEFLQVGAPCRILGIMGPFFEEI